MGTRWNRARAMAGLFPFYPSPPSPSPIAAAHPRALLVILLAQEAADPNREVVSSLPCRALITRGGAFPRLAASFDPLAISVEYLLLPLFSPSSGLHVRSVSQLRDELGG